MVSLSDIQRAAQAIRGIALQTPLVYAPAFSEMTGTHVYLKLETMQRAGSFKVRGATNKILSEKGRIGPAGVVAVSAGNHAQGVAVAAASLGIPATIVMPTWVSMKKQQATLAYGAKVILYGQNLMESLEKAKELVAQGYTFIHPYDDPAVIAGQGTVALEILSDLPEPDVIVAPVGGGGLISGVAIAAKAIRPSVRIVGVQAEACPCAYYAVREGRVLSMEAHNTIADGIRVQKVGDLTYPVIRDLVESVLLVSEEQIAEAIISLLEEKRLLAEGAGATPLAALLSGAVKVRRGENVVLIISGGNLDTHLLDRIIRWGMFRSGRIMRFTVCLADIPNELARLLSVVAGKGGNILDIHHARGGVSLSLNSSVVEIEVETNGFDHIDEIRRALEQNGYVPAMD